MALEKLRDVIAQCILPQAGMYVRIRTQTCVSMSRRFILHVRRLFAGDNENEKLNEVMHEAWRFNRDCKLLRDGLQGLSWDGKCFCL